MAGLHVDATEYQRVAAKLKAAPAKLKRDFTKRLNNAARPALKEALEEGAEPMPSRGGLRAHIVAQGSVGLSKAGWGIRVALQNKRVALGQLNDGVLRHPLFGNTKHWYSQDVPEGTFTDAFEAHTEEVQREVAKVFDDVSKSL